MMEDCIEDEDDLVCPECGAITFEGCQNQSAVRCEWLRGHPYPMDEFDDDEE